MAISGNMFLENPYVHSWEDIMILKKHCKWYMLNYKSWFDSNSLIRQSPKQILDICRERYNLTHKEEIYIINRKNAIHKSIDSKSKSNPSLNVKLPLNYEDNRYGLLDIIANIIAFSIKTRFPAIQMYVFYKEVLDRINMLEYEKNEVKRK